MGVASGYPDWQQIQQWIGAPLVSAAPAGGTTNYGPFNLASWRSLLVQLSQGGIGQSRVGLTWQRSAGAAIPVTRYAHFRSTGPHHWIVPNPLDRLLQAELILPATPGSQIVISPCNLEPVAFPSGDTGALVNSGVSVAAGATQSIYLPFYAGRAKLQFDANGGSWFVVGYALDHTLAILGRWLYDGPVTVRELYDLILPPAVNRLDVISNNAGALSYSAGVVGVEGFGLDG